MYLFSVRDGDTVIQRKKERKKGKRKEKKRKSGCLFGG